MTLKLSETDLDAIRRHAEDSYPEECAGAIAGTRNGDVKAATELWPADNVHGGERERRFLIEPLKFKEFEERADERGMELLGFYHSHPDHLAEPSDYDREHAWPGWSYVIASVSQRRVEDLRSWVLRDDRSGYDEEQLES